MLNGNNDSNAHHQGNARDNFWTEIPPAPHLRRTLEFSDEFFNAHTAAHENLARAHQRNEITLDAFTQAVRALDALVVLRRREGAESLNEFSEQVRRIVDEASNSPHRASSQQ